MFGLRKIVGSVSVDITGGLTASAMAIADAGGYYGTDNVEAALQAIGSGTTLDSRYVNVAGDTMTGSLVVGDDHFLNVDGSVVFNETGAAVDFRVEGDTNANALFVKGSTNKVGIGTASPDEVLHVIGNFLVEDADTATKGYRFKTSGSDLDIDFSAKPVYISGFQGAGFTSTQRFFLKFAHDSQYANGFGNWLFQDAIFGNDILGVRPDNGEIVVNDSGIDMDFRVEGDTDTSLFWIEATGDKIHVGQDSSSLIGFYGATAVDQPATVADPSGGATQDAEARTAIVAIIDRLQELGLIA